MDELIFSTWIPRTHLHLVRLNYLMKKMFLKRLNNVKLDNKEQTLTFNLDDKSLIVDADGVFLIKLKVSSGKSLKDLENKEIELKNLFNEILGKVMPILKSQIVEGLLPLKENYILITKNGLKTYEGLNKLTKHGFILHKSEDDSFKKITRIVFITNYHLNNEYFFLLSFAISFEFTLSDLMQKVVLLYDKTTEVNKRLEKTRLDLDDLGEITTFLADKTKDVNQMSSRIRQMKTNLNNKTNYRVSKKFSTIEERLFKSFEILEILNHANNDYQYIKELWVMLEQYVDRSLRVLNIVIGRQEAVESTRIESLLSVETAQIVAASFIAILFSTNLIDLARWQGIATVLIWLVLFLLITGIFKIRNKKQKKVFKTLYSKKKKK